jgi:hypothetical protein
MVAIIMLSLEQLFRENPITAYELTTLARDPSHVLWGNAVHDLTSLGLLQDDGSLHGAVRDVILAAVEGDGLAMHLISPVRA